jgi:acyl-coenzyme A synthetase/AMP-(fatty) acid ligase/thioesterase domain-containing protein/acyl carrier protein
VQIATAQPQGDADGFSYVPLDEIWRDIVRERGDELAACNCEVGGAQLTYRDVDALSDELAERAEDALQSGGVTRESPVAALVGHDPSAAVSAIAMYKIAWPEITLDPSVPLERLRSIVKASGVELVIASREHQALAAQLDVRVITMPDPASGAAGGAGRQWPSIDPDAVSGIVYTSGSTGAPKGVAGTYRSLGHHHFMRLRDDWIRPGDTFGLVMPLAFGAARGDLSSALLAGASVHFFDPRARGAGPLPGWLEKHRISVLSAPPSLLTAVARTLREGEQLSDSLRMVRSAGEKVLCSEAVAIRRVLPAGCRLLNAFGCSEAHMVSAYEITDATPDLPRPVPAGWPIFGFEVAIERPDGTVPEPGEAAELTVISRYLPVGYWRDPERTHLKYTTLADGRRAVATGDLAAWLPDGGFRLAGRIDFGVKIRGNLVEPSEVEGALLHCAWVQDAVVVGRKAPSGRERLIAYVVVERGAPIVRTADLRRELRQTLPSYMIPEVIVFLPELPRNERLKLDRAALPDPPERTVSDAVAPRTLWERRIAELWAAVLAMDELGAQDDFFDLGGDSLSAEEMVARLADEHGVQVSSRLLLEAPTVAEFAERLRAQATAARRDHTREESDRLVAIRRTGSRAPLFCVAGAGRLGMTYLPLAKRLSEDQPVWALQAGGREQQRFKDWSVRRTARRNVAAVRSVQPHGPYLLAGHSIGGVIAFEMAHQLEAAGEKVALLVSLDSFPPHPAALPPIRRRSAAEWLATVKRVAASCTGRALKSALSTPAQPVASRVRPGDDVFIRQSRVVSLLYRGRPYAGRTLVLVAQDEPAKDHFAWRGEGWAPYLSGPWRAQLVPGVHSTMLNEPHAAGLATVLEAEITAALS